MNKTQITIEELVKKAHETIVALGYAKYTTEIFQNSWNGFKNYAVQNEIIHYSTEFLLMYSEEKYQIITEPNSTTYKQRQYNLSLIHI